MHAILLKRMAVFDLHNQNIKDLETNTLINHQSSDNLRLHSNNLRLLISNDSTVSEIREKANDKNL